MGYGLWAELVCGSKVFTLRWAGLGWVSRLVGYVGLKKLDPRTTLKNLSQCDKMLVKSVLHRHTACRTLFTLRYMFCLFLYICNILFYLFRVFRIEADIGSLYVLYTLNRDR